MQNEIGTHTYVSKVVILAQHAGLKATVELNTCMLANEDLGEWWFDNLLNNADYNDLWSLPKYVCHFLYVTSM